MFVEALSYLDPLIKDGDGLTVTEIKDFVSSLAENYDPALYNIYSKIRVLDNYNDTIEFCPSYWSQCANEMCFSSDISVKRTAAKMREMNVVKSFKTGVFFAPLNIASNIFDSVFISILIIDPSALILEEIAIDSHNKELEDRLLQEAHDLHLASLQLAKKAFGEDNVQTAKHYGNLGRLYQSMHFYEVRHWFLTNVIFSSLILPAFLEDHLF